MRRQTKYCGRRNATAVASLLAATVLALGTSCQMLGSGGNAGMRGATTRPTTRPAPYARVRSGKPVAGVYDVRSFGATGNGKTIDSPAINKAIETAAANGGGTVRFPAGTYLSYSIRLKSNITLYLDTGAKILAANIHIHGGSGYDHPEPIGDTERYQDFGHSHWRNSLIWGENIENVAIMGPGMIDGGLYPNPNAPTTAPTTNPGRGGRGRNTGDLALGTASTSSPSDALAAGSTSAPAEGGFARGNNRGGGFGGFGGFGGPGGGGPPATITGLSNGIDGGGLGRGAGGARGGFGRGGTTQPTSAPAFGGGRGRGAPRGGGFANGGGRGRGRGGFGGGFGGPVNNDPFANALAQLAARNNAPATTQSTDAGNTDEQGGPNAAPGGGGGGGGGRPNTQFPSTPAADLTRPYRSDSLPLGVGNKAISLKLCKNVTLSGFSVLRGGHFALLATGVDNLTIDNLKIDTNRDGFDIDGCRNVRISNCAINSPADDAIVLKSSYALGFNRSCENITITNCLVCGGWEVGSMLAGTYVERNPGTGRIKFGTESNGGFKNITISNCVFDRCQGLALEAVDGAIIDNVSISNITMREIGSLPIFIRLGDRRRGPVGETTVGAIRHVNISDIVAQNRAAQYACEITGIPGHPIEDVRISNVRLIWPGGAPAGISQIVPPENEFQYPEPGMFGVLPTYGFFIRHVTGVNLTNIEMSYTKPDMRPPFYLEDVRTAEFNLIKAPHETGVPLFMLKNVQGFRTHEVRGLPDTQKDSIEQETLPASGTTAATD